MALAGEAHVIIFGVDKPHGPARVRGQQRGHHRRLGRLRFLAAKSAAHPLADHHHLIERNPQDLGDHLLHFGGMLRRGMDRHGLALAGDGDANHRFQIKMLLPADFQDAFDAVIRLGKSRGNDRRALCVGQVRGTIGRDRLVDA